LDALETNVKQIKARIKTGMKTWGFLALMCIFFLELCVSQKVQAGTIPSATEKPDNISSQATTIQPDEPSFPAATQPPKSIWRPPLYAIPYALSPHDHFYLDRPIAVTSVNWPLANYRYGYQDAETPNPHTGVDIDAPLHTPILAAADGKIIFTGYGLALGAGNTADPYGLAVVIRHDFSFEGQSVLTVYAHMEKIAVQVGQRVKTGDTLGYVGLTGNTTGPHVHFEVRLEKNNTYMVQNPELWMAPPTDCGVLVGQFKDVSGIYLTGKTVWIKSESSGNSWTILTYADQEVRNDDYYGENLVLGDLPIGKYQITFYYSYHYYEYEIAISPGAITFVSFAGSKGFSTGVPMQKDTNSFLVPFHN
jgi:hypothetical protein